MKFDVFISHSSEDAPLASELCLALRDNGLRCWIAPESIAPSMPWADAIVDGINESHLVLLVLSEHANVSGNVQNEIGLAADKNKPIIPVTFANLTLSPFMELHLSRTQRLDASRILGKALHQVVVDAVAAVVPKKARARKTASTGSFKPRRTQPTPARRRFWNLTTRTRFDRTATPLTFKGRQAELKELLSSIRSGTHTAIFGLQRMGKTSLIDEGLDARLPEAAASGREPLLARIDFQTLGGEQVRYRDLMTAISDSVIEKMRPHLPPGRTVQDVSAAINGSFATGGFDRGDRTKLFERFSRTLKTLADYAGRRIVLFIDEFSEVRKVMERSKSLQMSNPLRDRTILPQDMYIDGHFMRHLSAMLKDADLKKRFTLILSVRPFMAEYDKAEDLQILKLCKPIPLYRLDETAAKALITDPVAGKVDYEPGAVEYLYQLTAGHPYLLQFMLKILVDRVRDEAKRTIDLAAIATLEEQMVSEGAGYESQFAVMISDYSVDEVTHPKEAELGKGTLALISKHGMDDPEGWVQGGRIFDEFQKHRVPETKASSLLSQLSRTRIVEEKSINGDLCYRIAVPLVRKRFVRQNLYLKYFRRV